MAADVVGMDCECRVVNRVFEDQGETITGNRANNTTYKVLWSPSCPAWGFPVVTALRMDLLASGIDEESLVTLQEVAGQGRECLRPVSVGFMGCVIN